MKCKTSLLFVISLLALSACGAIGDSEGSSLKSELEKQFLEKQTRLTELDKRIIKDKGQGKLPNFTAAST